MKTEERTKTTDNRNEVENENEHRSNQVKLKDQKSQE